jgi:hypothetical protein
MPDPQDRDILAYPDDLEAIEDALLRRRRGLSETAAVTDKVGFGLSGGGIRSATFCLGLFQGLARQSLPEAERKCGGNTPLAKIDFLSTVSGGGFFGAFLGRLFTRDGVRRFSDAEEILSARKVSEQTRRKSTEQSEGAREYSLLRGNTFRWLRENGRYLAPNGAGDLLLGGAVITRNLIAVQLVLATFFMMLFLGAQLVRGGFEVWAVSAAHRAHGAPRMAAWLRDYQSALHHLFGASEVFRWSPYSILAALVFLFLVIPPAWSYWLVDRPGRKTAGRWIPPVWGLLAVIFFSLVGCAAGVCARWGASACRWCGAGRRLNCVSARLFGAGPEHSAAPIWICALILIVASETVIWALWSGWRPAFMIAADDSAATFIADDEKLRFTLSVQLKTALTVLGVVFGFVLVDSVAQTVYVTALLGHGYLRIWASSALASMVAVASFARKILAMFGDKSGGKRIGIPLRLLAGAAALIVGALFLIALDVGAYAICWELRLPVGALQQSAVQRTLSAATALKAADTHAGRTNAPAPCPKLRIGARDCPSDLEVPAAAFALSVLFSFLFGWSWPFLNRSTQHPTYTSRLIRAYLGASNPRRLGPRGTAVTQTIEGDDIAQYQYWPRFSYLLGKRSGSQSVSEQEAKLFGAKAMPIHLVNVTINETLDGRSLVEQLDRKGIGMAIGPGGFSAGVVHHCVLTGPGAGNEETGFAVHPDQGADGCDDFKIFRYGKKFEGELLSVGGWTGISGAAFSTSLGWRTSLGFSFLAGMANVRLTYWWNSGTQPLDLVRRRMRDVLMRYTPDFVSAVFPALHRRMVADSDQMKLPKSTASRWRRWLSASMQFMFSVQAFLLDELFARFHGTARQWWPLSDGGHFENMGGYELIRRRLPIIAIVDAEADPDYTFEGLANLVRKARLDFGAEIRFLKEEELDARVHSSVRRYFGTLEQLRRGTWVKEPVADPIAPPPPADARARPRLSINPVDEEALSLASAALAEVTYRRADGTPSPDKPLLLYIKPALTGDEPADVHRYHSEHPSFPHETTAEQFFDEAQWESYRRLGEHIADKIFRVRDDRNNPLSPEPGKFLPCALARPAAA